MGDVVSLVDTRGGNGTVACYRLEPLRVVLRPCEADLHGALMYTGKLVFAQGMEPLPLHTFQDVGSFEIHGYNSLS